MTNTINKMEIKEIIDEIENNSSNNWDELCAKCSSIIKESGMTEKEINEIVNNCKQGQ